MNTLMTFCWKAPVSLMPHNYDMIYPLRACYVRVIRHFLANKSYRQVSYIRRTLVDNKIFRSLRCSRSIACRRCSNYIFILDLTPDFIGLGKDNCTASRETFKFGDLVRLILEILRYSKIDMLLEKFVSHKSEMIAKTSQIIAQSTACSRYLKSHGVERECVFLLSGCEYGDTQEWCSSIGDRYALSSCYGNQDICCRTCPKLRLHIPGNEIPWVLIYDKYTVWFEPM